MSYCITAWLVLSWREILVPYFCAKSYFCHFVTQRQCVGWHFLWRCGCVSVMNCLSRWCIVPKRLSRSSRDLHLIVAQPLYYSHTKYEPSRSTGSSLLRASDERGVGKSHVIRLCCDAVDQSRCSNVTSSSINSASRYYGPVIYSLGWFVSDSRRTGVDV